MKIVFPQPMGPHTIDVQGCFQRTSILRNDQFDFLARLQKVKKKRMTLYVNNSRRKVKFKLWNKLINAAAAAAAVAATRAARSRTPACASRQEAPQLTNG